VNGQKLEYWKSYEGEVFSREGVIIVWANCFYILGVEEE
jgi:hypothetical protein